MGTALVDTEKVLTDFSDGVALMTINRPRARNAVDAETAAALAAAVDELDARDDLVVGILTGAGGAFCAGMDLKAFARGERPSLPGRGFAGIVEKPPVKPLIVAVEGWALAGGCELVLAADLVVASREARFGLPEVSRGLVAGGGGLLRLPNVLPYPVAMQMALTGDPVSAETAHRYGLVTTLTEPGSALAEARALAARIARNGPLAVRTTKQILAAAAGHTDPADFAMQREAVETVLASEDAAEGARAFAEKRDPVWTGR
ncbi:crotonase/enoyl-CoA hydratase family protein [Pseudonocardia sp. RS11V-5]|uniref:crotonase/enoyl-CoA hydratase family protein n=1 Tax=Pseudonocardia terrae TaxID=2905831 RepID=UPI001E599294|nr:crotonase/enoyl-CoA hydratase family protein [Pseudonocardia terrae]MCE3555924.1 crotonase/enoyl-CoA hydratase family protein [Pseudonocardia terrae]